MTNHGVSVKTGERIRFRFCNVANASSFAVQIADHDVTVIAIDGQPVEPFKAQDGVVLLSPGQRMDVMVDMTRNPGSTSKVRLLGFEQEVMIGRLVYAKGERARKATRDNPARLPSNPLATNLDFHNAVDATLTMDGGAMGGMRGAKVNGEYLGMQRLVRVKKGRTVRLRMINNTSWPHAMHIHGHHFKHISGGAGDGYGPVWRDTIAASRGQELTTAFVADNPGKWMIHCHMLEHQEGGMATWFQVVA